MIYIIEKKLYSVVRVLLGLGYMRMYRCSSRWVLGTSCYVRYENIIITPIEINCLACFVFLLCPPEPASSLCVGWLLTRHTGN